MEVIKILKGPRKVIDRNRDHCYEDLETIKMSQSKLKEQKLKSLGNLLELLMKLMLWLIHQMFICLG